jgi:hypothetical protein
MGAPWYPVDGCRKLSEIPQHPMAHALRLGFGDFDDCFRQRLGDFYVIGGTSSPGKSTVRRELYRFLDGTLARAM